MGLVKNQMKTVRDTMEEIDSSYSERGVEDLVIETDCVYINIYRNMD